MRSLKTEYPETEIGSERIQPSRKQAMADLSCDDSINVGTPAQPQSQAMGAARRDPRRGEIPVTHSQVRFLFLPLPGEVVSGIQAIICNYQISEGEPSCCATIDAAGRLFRRGI